MSDGFRHSIALDTPTHHVYLLEAERVGAAVLAHSHAQPHVAQILRGRARVELLSPDGLEHTTFDAGAGHRSVFDVPAGWGHRMVALELPTDITCTFAKFGPSGPVPGDPKDPGRLEVGTRVWETWP